MRCKLDRLYTGTKVSPTGIGGTAIVAVAIVAVSSSKVIGGRFDLVLVIFYMFDLNRVLSVVTIKYGPSRTALGQVAITSVGIICWSQRTVVIELSTKHHITYALHRG